MIPSLINKRDNFEIVRDEIVGILTAEVDNQKALAVDGLLDPTPWDFRIFRERTSPWEEYRSADYDPRPIINVWFDTETFDGTHANNASKTRSDAVFNIDCYAAATSEDDPGAGHIPGDQAAVIAAQNAVKFVRNVLMSESYMYLGMRGTVGTRWVRNVTSFQPTIDNTSAQRVAAHRVAFSVGFIENAPEVEGEPLALVSNAISIADSGEATFNVDFEYEE